MSPESLAVLILQGWDLGQPPACTACAASGPVPQGCRGAEPRRSLGRGREQTFAQTQSQPWVSEAAGVSQYKAVLPPSLPSSLLAAVSAAP